VDTDQLLEQIFEAGAERMGAYIVPPYKTHVTCPHIPMIKWADEFYPSKGATMMPPEKMHEVELRPALVGGRIWRIGTCPDCRRLYVVKP
jgi:hypothetical protein